MSAHLPSLKIGDRRVSAVDPCYVIAEIGVNHNGNVDCARRLVDVAVECGADAVKFQTFRTAELVTQDAPKAGYQAKQTGDGGQAAMLHELELRPADFELLNRHCAERAIDFISTAFDEQSLHDVIALRPKCLKWPSGELTNQPLLRVAAQSRLPIILSTGMAWLSEVATALEFLEREHSGDVAVLQCVSNYPAALAEQNLACIATMARAFGLVTGFSDHTEGPWAAIAARPLGMAILEKHITLDRNMPGPDHGASMEPQAFAELIKTLRLVEEAIGDGVKRPTSSEADTRAVARKSLVYATALNAGHVLSAADLKAKRPGNGIGPDSLPLLLGRRLKDAVRSDQMAEFSDVD